MMKSVTESVVAVVHGYKYLLASNRWKQW